MPSNDEKKAATAERNLQIVNAALDGQPMKDLAKLYGVSYGRITFIVRMAKIRRGIHFRRAMRHDSH